MIGSDERIWSGVAERVADWGIDSRAKGKTEKHFSKFLFLCLFSQCRDREVKMRKKKESINDTTGLSLPELLGLVCDFWV